MIKKGSQLENVYVGELTVLEEREGRESCNLGLRVLLGVGESGGRTGGVMAEASLWLLLPQPLPAKGTLKLFRNSDFRASSHLYLSKHRSAAEQSEPQGRGGK